MHLFTKIADNVWETFNNYKCYNFVHLILRYLMAITKLIMYVTYIFKESIRACKYSGFYIWNVNSSMMYFHQYCEQKINLFHIWNKDFKSFMTQK